MPWGISSGVMAMEHDPAKTIDLLCGAVDKYVKQRGRNTIMDNAARDSACIGWTRIAADDACDFCKTLSSRTFQYKTKASASQPYHSHCGCGIAVAFKTRDGKVVAEGVDGTDIDDWNPDEMYQAYVDEHMRFKHNRERENMRRAARRRKA